ncbi:MAG: PadR family transcriptional regulator [Proteobacteria bacterium]|nr:PadR family transcriptional regulator [Pseudomonadota bacterium]MBU1581282.1 PadR family transcriptional regulator [Pseudomonadota bacterium]MBU2454397.1 PadR family transcriptional regulator [Pseudomonadota bacterium]MBU2627036.1 PadR family transcriptional regulator [Pseudomonadota bacterium]
MKINKSRYAILGLLSMGPMSGYDIKKKFEKIASNFWNESYGQIYPILKRLNAEGLAVKTIEKQIGKPDRHVYELTRQGHEKLMEWLKEPVDRHIGRHEILLKLFFGPMISVNDNIKQIQQFQKIYEKELTDLKTIKETIKMDHNDQSHLPYWLMTIRFGELVNKALIQWSRESCALLEKMND